MKKPFVIGLTGPARSGKTTTARRIDWALDSGAPIFGFADPIKWAIKAMGFGPEPADKESTFPLDLGVSYRRMAQTLGTEWGRDVIHPDIWLRLMQARVAEASDWDIVVIHDVRFENEAKWIRANGKLVHVARSAALRGVPVESHSSEGGVSVDREDFVLLNDGDMAQLKKDVERFLGLIDAHIDEGAPITAIEVLERSKQRGM